MQPAREDCSERCSQPTPTKCTHTHTHFSGVVPPTRKRTQSAILPKATRHPPTPAGAASPLLPCHPQGEKIPDGWLLPAQIQRRPSTATRPKQWHENRNQAACGLDGKWTRNWLWAACSHRIAVHCIHPPPSLPTLPLRWLFLSAFLRTARWDETMLPLSFFVLPNQPVRYLQPSRQPTSSLAHRSPLRPALPPCCPLGNSRCNCPPHPIPHLPQRRRRPAAVPRPLASVGVHYLRGRPAARRGIRGSDCWVRMSDPACRLTIFWSILHSSYFFFLLFYF